MTQFQLILTKLFTVTNDAFNYAIGAVHSQDDYNDFSLQNSPTLGQFEGDLSSRSIITKFDINKENIRHADLLSPIKIEETYPIETRSLKKRNIFNQSIIVEPGNVNKDIDDFINDLDLDNIIPPDPNAFHKILDDLYQFTHPPKTPFYLPNNRKLSQSILLSNYIQ